MTGRDNPLVSIGVPVFNGSRGIERCLRSVLTQSYDRLELVISDNASTDDTPEICGRICSNDDRAHYVRQPRNVGPSKNFDAVLERARGDYFMWLGHDDWLSAEYVKECARALDDDSDVSLACGEAVYYRSGDESSRGEVVQLPQESPEERVVAYYHVVADNGTFYGLMRRQQLLGVSRHNVMGGDWLMVASMAFLGKVVTLPAVRVHRALGGSTVSYEKIARNLGLSRFQALFPHVAIAAFAFRDIAWRDPLYTLGRARRFRLAWECQRIIRHRHDSSLRGILHKCAVLAKQAGVRLVGAGDGVVAGGRDR